ncbi:MAG: hypothetical protein ACTSQ8_16735 [Candidatus Helarchaeota archaeon]
MLAELINFQPTGKLIYNQKFGQLDDDLPLINKFISSIPSLVDYDSGIQPIGKVQFIYSGYNDLFFVICADKTDDVISLVQVLETMKVEFAQKYFPLIKEGKDDPALFRTFRDEVDQALAPILQKEGVISPHDVSTAPVEQKKFAASSSTAKELIKIAFIGTKGAGKRTLLTLLFSGPSGTIPKLDDTEMVMKKGPISDKYNALLITMPNSMIEDGKTQFLSNTDVILFVNSSVFKDVMATRKIYDIIKPILPTAKYAVIANKQDITGAVEVNAIQRVYDLPTIGMVAIDLGNFEKLKNFIEKILESP